MMHPENPAQFLKDYSLKYQQGGATGVLNQSMYPSKIRSISEAYDEALAINKSKENNKPFYTFKGSRGNNFDYPSTDIIHDINKHGLTKEQAEVIIDNSENFIYAYEDKKVKGYHGGIAVLCKVKTPDGNAGIMYEFMPNGRVFLGTMFFDTDVNIDNWAKKAVPV